MYYDFQPEKGEEGASLEDDSRSAIVDIGDDFYPFSLTENAFECRCRHAVHNKGELTMQKLKSYNL